MAGNEAEDTLILETTRGPVTIAMRPDLAPGHVARIKELVREGFYDGVKFHRVIDGFMAQTGCPQGTGTGGSGPANPDSGDSQFFICFAESAWLDNQYTIWGEVTDGMDNVDQINRGEPPREPDQIISIKVAADAA